MGGVTYYLWFLFILESWKAWKARKARKPGKLESWKARKLESLESHQKAKSRGEKERKKAVVLSTVLYYEWMPIRIVIFIYYDIV